MRQAVRKTIILISFLCLPITFCFFSPVIIVQDAAKGIISGSFVVFTVVSILSLFTGRLFCGWLCPCGGGQECMTMIRLTPVKGGWRNYIKYIVSAIWISVIVYFAVQSGGYTEFDFLNHTDNGISLITNGKSMAYPIYYVVLSLILFLTLVFGRRAFCHYLCWLAPLIIIGTKIRKQFHIPGLRLKAHKEDCIGCEKCNSVCPMSLNVYDMVQKNDMNDNECILCTACTDACPKKAIRISMKSR